MDILKRIDEDTKKALKAGEKIRLQVLRQLRSVIRNAEIAKQAVLHEKDVLQVIKTELKKRKESVEAFVKGKREELAENERKEAKVLNEYLPEQMPDDELAALVAKKADELNAHDTKDFGKLMGAVMKEAGIRVDGDRVKTFVQKQLA